MASVITLSKRLQPLLRMGGGLATVGLAGYAMLGLAGHALEPGDYAALTSLYFCVNIVGPGLFVAVEQETSRAVSQRLAAGQGTRTTLLAATKVAALLTGVVVAVLLALSPLLVPRAFGGQWGLLLALVVGAVGAAGMHLHRGMFGGQQRFSAYSGTLFGLGILRLLPCLLLFVAGASTGLGYGFAFAAAAVVVTLGAMRGLRTSPGGPSVGFGKLAGATGLLAGTWLLSHLVANLAPVVVNSRLVQHSALAATFGTLFIIARMPMFVFSPVQALLLPALTRAAEAADVALIRRRVVGVLAAVAGLGIPGALIAALLGPWMAQAFFDAQLRLSSVLAGLLAVGTLLAILAQVLQPALVALGGHAIATRAWVIGTGAFLCLLFLPIDPIRAAVAAQLAAPALVTALMAWGFRLRLRRLGAGDMGL